MRTSPVSLGPSGGAKLAIPPSAGLGICFVGRPRSPLLPGSSLEEICPRGNNKVVILYFLIHYKGLLLMLELY